MSGSRWRRSGFVCLVAAMAVAATACGGKNAPPNWALATPNPTAQARARSAFEEGMEAFQAGKYDFALAAFNRARLEDQERNGEIIEMIERTRALLEEQKREGTPPASLTPDPG